MTVDGLKMAKYRMFFDSAKAERELGYSARPFELALKDALAWFRGARDICDEWAPLTFSLIALGDLDLSPRLSRRCSG